MGRHPVKPAAVPGPGRLPVVFLPHLFLLLVTLLAAAPVGNSRSFNSGAAALYPEEVEDAYLEEEEVTQLSTEEIERLKKRILEGLGLTRIPDVTKMNVSQEEYERMYKVYLNSVEETRKHREQESALDEERDGQITAHRFYSFTHAGHLHNRIRRSETKAISTHKRNGTVWLYFPVDIPEAYQQQQVDVDHATLRLFVSGLHPEEAAKGGNTVDVRVFQIVDSLDSSNGEERLLVDQRRIHLAAIDSKWTEFDLTRTTEAWVSGNSRNLGIEVECMECARRGITLVTQETQGSNSSISPVLNILVKVHVQEGREKRSVVADHIVTHRSKHIECHKDNQRCCRAAMQVIFKDIGFDFILQPLSFDAGYCKGRCPARFNPAHGHALLQSLVWKQKRAPRPCCAPRKLDSLEVLHVDEHHPDKLKRTVWDEVKVIQCACS